MFDDSMNRGKQSELTSEAEHQAKLKRVMTNARYASSECMLSFDDMMFLSEHAPQVLEQFRLRVCEEVIESAPANMRHRLEGLQFVVDMERERSQSPLDACVRISKMMHDSLNDLSLALKDPKGYAASKLANSAQILQMPRRV